MLLIALEECRLKHLVVLSKFVCQERDGNVIKMPTKTRVVKIDELHFVVGDKNIFVVEVRVNHAVDITIFP